MKMMVPAEAYLLGVLSCTKLVWTLCLFLACFLWGDLATSAESCRLMLGEMLRYVCVPVDSLARFRTSSKYLQGLDKIMETLQILYIFLY
jgi:hypothetical protein